MTNQTFITLFLIMLLINTLHIFEEIGMEAYTLIPNGSLKKYLLVASVIMTVNTLIFLAILLDKSYGLTLGILSGGFALLNGIIHTAGYIKERKFKGTLAAGFFTGIPLGILGLVVLISIFSA